MPRGQGVWAKLVGAILHLHNEVLTHIRLFGMLPPSFPSAKLWDVQSGAQLFYFNFDSPARAIDFSVGDKLAVITTDPFMGLTSAIHVKRIAADPDDQVGESVPVLKGPQGRINRAVWGPLNKTIIGAGEDVVVRIWDTEDLNLIFYSVSCTYTLSSFRNCHMIDNIEVNRPESSVCLYPIIHCIETDMWRFELADWKPPAVSFAHSSGNLLFAAGSFLPNLRLQSTVSKLHIHRRNGVHLFSSSALKVSS
ncbi:hypothetical protein L1887_37523 [Cichorium endivia]|nr:hypothetical protein L1887_37523 [Cichorium endivia]